MKTHIYKGGRSLLFKNILEMWLKEKKEFVKESTYAYYHFEIQNYIIPALGETAADKITEKKIQNAVLMWQNTGMQNGGPLKKSTVQNLVMLIKQVIRYAIRKCLMQDFSFQVFFASHKERQVFPIFSSEEQKHLIIALLNDLNYKTFGILLSMNSGLRIGELCALKWSDIDTDNQLIHVRKTLQRIYLKNEQPKTCILIASPKTNSSIRDIPISDKMLSIILKLKDRDANGYVISNTDKYIEPRTFRKFYTNFLKSNDMRILHFHCLRHTFATRCIENGAEYKSLSEILGHATVNMTLKMYVHPSLESKMKCVNMISWD